MKLFFVALAFLSIIPLKKASQADTKMLGKSMRYFPLVGMFFGAVLAAVAYLLSKRLSAGLIGLIMTFILVSFSRGNHLDGLADSADGLLGGSSRNDVLRIMRDSSIGAFGAGVIVLDFIAKFVLLSSVPFNKTGLAIIILMPALARWGAVYASYLYRPGRNEGLAYIFLTSLGIREFLIATFIVGAGTIILLPLNMALFILITYFLLLAVLTHLLTKKIGGVTGDILGALIEIGEIAALLIGVAILQAKVF